MNYGLYETRIISISTSCNFVLRTAVTAVFLIKLCESLELLEVVDLGSIPSSSPNKRLKKLVFTSSLLNV